MKKSVVIISGAVATFALGVSAMLGFMPNSGKADSQPSSENIVTNQQVKATNEQNNQLLDLINNARIEKGLTKLEMTDSLNMIAEWKADDMQNRNYFYAVDPEISQIKVTKNFDFTFSPSNTNIIKGYSDYPKAYQLWSGTTPTTETMLNPEFSKTGICKKTIKIDGKDSVVIIQVFSK